MWKEFRNKKIGRVKDLIGKLNVEELRNTASSSSIRNNEQEKLEEILKLIGRDKYIVDNLTKEESLILAEYINTLGKGMSKNDSAIDMIKNIVFDNPVPCYNDKGKVAYYSVDCNFRDKDNNVLYTDSIMVKSNNYNAIIKAIKEKLPNYKGNIGPVGSVVDTPDLYDDEKGRGK